MIDKTSFKHDQIQAIKERLNNALIKAGLKTSPLVEKLKQETDFGDTIQRNTVISTLNYSTDALNVIVVIAICRLLHLDTAYIFSPPGTADPELPDEQTGNGKFVVFDDPKYFGIFHGFLYSPNHESSELIRFELDIKKIDKKVTAIMHYHGHPRTVDGEVITEDRDLYGTPCLCTGHSNVYITLTNDIGDFYTLYFNYQKFRSHNLYFRRGAAVTGSSLQGHPVLLQNFVLFARRVPDDKLDYIPGLLADVPRTFHISKAKLDSLRKQDPLIEEFYQSFSYVLEHDAATMYPINEEQILLSQNQSMQKEDVIRALILLKGESTALNRTVYNDIEDYSIFGKNFLQRQFAYKNERSVL